MQPRASAASKLTLTMPSLSIARTERSDILGRYYTRLNISSLLVSQLKRSEPKTLVDLGSGAGALTVAAIRAWDRVTALTVDIDPGARARIARTLHGIERGRHTHFQVDALGLDLPVRLNSDSGPIDLAICNPPFVRPKWRRAFSSIVEAAGFNSCLPKISDASAALLFLSQNLRLLGDDGTLGIIIPDSLASAAKYRRFREVLLNRYAVERIITLPRSSFIGTDAQAHILIMSKSRALGNILMQRLERSGALSEELGIPVERASERFDYEFHFSPKSTQRTGTSTTLSALILECERGSLSSAESRRMSFPVLHTTDLARTTTPKWRALSTTYHAAVPEKHSRLKRARPGDILVARVGRHLEEQIVGIANGSPIISDCVYRIRVAPCIRRTLLEQLTSLPGRSWLASRAFGVSARQLSKHALLCFPVTVEKTPRRSRSKE